MSTSRYHHLSHAPSPGAPLIFAFHGTGADETQFFGLMRQMLPEAGVIAPRGDVSEFGANRFFRRTGEGVYDMDDLADRTDAMAGFMRAHKQAHAGAPVFAVGYSNGANILASVMMKAPDLVDRAALLHPLIPWDPAPVPGLAGRSVLVTGGAQDPICPLPRTNAFIDYLRAQGADVTPLIHAGGHEVRPAEITALQAFFAPEELSRPAKAASL